MMSPDKQQELATDAMHGWQRWWQYVTEPARQSSDPVRPLAQDKRFSDPAWSAWPWHQRWQDFLPYVDPDNWQARVPQADGSWWQAWESRLTPCGFKRGAAGAAGECSTGTGQLRVAGVNGCATGNQWPAWPATPAQQLQQQQRQLQEQRTGNKPAFFLLHARTCYTQPNQTAPTRSLRPLPNFKFQPNAASSHPALE